MLRVYLRLAGRNKRKYESAMMEAYEKILLDETKEEKKTHDIFFYQRFVLFDLLHIMGYDAKNLAKERKKKLAERYGKDFSESGRWKEDFNKIFQSFMGSERRLSNLAKNPDFQKEAYYIELIRKNISFLNSDAYNIMVTATMSAGKSTFINSLSGKYVCLSQNMACTSKIHRIMNKGFEDGFSYEYDHDLVMTAGREELLNDNEKNSLDTIIVSTRFIGALENARVIVGDSPGVNFSGEEEHRKITEKLLKKKDYKLLIYVMNATQLATNDEDIHLNFVKKIIGRIPVIFVINKIDSFDIEEEDIHATIRRQTEYLKEKGFSSPVVCPVSARAGYLSKQFSNSGLSRSEERELYNFVDKFEKMNLTEYYSQNFKKIQIPDAEKEEEQLYKTCGLAYVEEIINNYIKGGK